MLLLIFSSILAYSADLNPKQIDEAALQFIVHEVDKRGQFKPAFGGGKQIAYTLEVPGQSSLVSERGMGLTGKARFCALLISLFDYFLIQDPEASAKSSLRKTPIGDIELKIIETENSTKGHLFSRKVSLSEITSSSDGRSTYTNCRKDQLKRPQVYGLSSGGGSSDTLQMAKNNKSLIEEYFKKNPIQPNKVGADQQAQ